MTNLKAQMVRTRIYGIDVSTADVSTARAYVHTR